MFSPHLRRQSRRSVRLEPSYRRATPPRASIRSRLTAPAVRVGSERRGYVLILEGSSERSLAEKTKSDDMTPTRGNVVAILSNSGKANPRAFAEERLGVLASNHKSAGNDAAALRCEITVPEGSHGGGCGSAVAAANFLSIFDVSRILGRLWTSWKVSGCFWTLTTV